MKRLFSGVQPSGRIHLGNYLGAIKQWVALQDEFEAIFCVVDLHAITVPQDSETLRKKTLEAVKIYLALGVDPKRAHIFVQSQVPEHSELMWILNTVTRNGDLTKMTQFKDKSGVDFDDFESKTKLIFDEKNIFDDFESKNISKIDKTFLLDLVTGYVSAASKVIVEVFEEKVKMPFNSIGVGLFDYPVLMASDILLYDTEVVPVGEDQVQHVELTRTLARRFNKRFGETFFVPRSKVMEAGARIMGLDDPSKKMSKSATSEYNFIALDDDVELARKKIMRAVTDSGSDITYSDDRPGLKNLITIYSLLSEETSSEIVSRYVGKGYADFKKDLADIVANFLTDFQKKYTAISDRQALKVVERGRKFVAKIAQKKMQEVKQKVGFLG